MSTPPKPSPGSDAAVSAGCLCARMDNGYGGGYLGQAGIFVMREDCPLHGSAALRALAAEAEAAGGGT